MRERSTTTNTRRRKKPASFFAPHTQTVNPANPFVAALNNLKVRIKRLFILVVYRCFIFSFSMSWNTHVILEWTCHPNTIAWYFLKYLCYPWMNVSPQYYRVILRVIPCGHMKDPWHNILIKKKKHTSTYFLLHLHLASSCCSSLIQSWHHFAGAIIVARRITVG